MLSRLSFVLAPLLILITTGFALNYLYAAVVHARARSWPFAGFYALLGVAGLALAIALWRGRRQARAAMRAAADAADVPRA